ncbi:peptidoglycan DD-metalloendopeptidase family protein [Erysipelothrix anatis]|uniref:peptidoglycan DD-metalloendopeptidase family protein n=1 Tax=Erysipelothrix anatis TaxID=2683713 RepID=UPI00140B1539|nr:peptidoglycan DD-metalloendopeptidase family protein [Erysipelothrix anatis]
MKKVGIISVVLLISFTVLLAVPMRVQADTDNGYVLLAHMRNGTLKVSPGDTVHVGKPIGIMGNTGVATGEHVHIEYTRTVLNDPGERLNPSNYINIYQTLGVPSHISCAYGNSCYAGHKGVDIVPNVASALTTVLSPVNGVVVEAKYSSTWGNYVRIRLTSNTNGWKLENGKWRYYVNGNFVTGWRTIGNEEYYFDKTTGYAYINQWMNHYDISYYFNSSGHLVKNSWISWGGKDYYANFGGHIIKNNTMIYNTITYYFNTNGELVKNSWWEKDGYEYYSNSGGHALKNQVMNYYDITYYFNDSGQLVKNGWWEKDGYEYYSNSGGHALKNQVMNYNTITYYFDGNGQLVKNNWWKMNGNDYYSNAGGHALKDNLLNLDSKLYYFKVDGTLAKNERVIYKGISYVANEIGVLSKI